VLAIFANDMPNYFPATRPRGTSSPRLARSTNFKQKEDHMTKREEQTQARRQLQTAVQSVIDCFIDELSRLDQHTTDIATAASRIMPKTIPSLTEGIQKRRAMGNPAPPLPIKNPRPAIARSIP
jgi:hypothetical protein